MSFVHAAYALSHFNSIRSITNDEPAGAMLNGCYENSISISFVAR